MRTTLRASLIAGAALAALSSANAAPVQHSLTGSKLLIENVVGNVTVIVSPGAQGVQIVASGDDRFTSLLSFKQNGDRAEILMGDISYRTDENFEPMKLTVTVAPGTDLSIDDLIGDASIGDLKAPIAIGAIAGDIIVGSVTSASLEVSGSADITITEATGALNIDTSGSGEIKVGRAGATAISISGSGDASIGAVGGSLGIDLSGSADVTIGSVDGATAVSTSGSSDVYIGGGRANPFAADTSGSGDVIFAGTAVNTQVSSSGSGSICLGATEGSLQTDSDITVSPTACKRS